MKTLVFLLTLSLSHTLLASCPDLAGDFIGTCKESFQDSTNNKDSYFEVRITQNLCSSMEVLLKSGEYTTLDSYNFNLGLSEVSKTPHLTVYSGGAYSQNGFSGTVLYSSNSGVVSIYNEYEVTKEGSKEFLMLYQKARGYKMECKLEKV